MDLADKKVWQVAAGDNQRQYDDICLHYQVMMIGPGERGPFDEDTYRDVPSSSKNAVRRFYSGPRRGDVALLRLGTSRVLAVGEVVGDSPTHVEEFGDIDGWRLQHCWPVRWTKVEKTFEPGTFRGRFGRVNHSEVLKWARAFTYPKEARTPTPSDLPTDTGQLGDEELGALLVKSGMSVERVAQVLTARESLHPLIQWLREQGATRSGRPSEHETISYLVVPLLFSLGWSQKTLAIEWNNIDIALFPEPTHRGAHPTCGIEVKSLDRSVFAPRKQATGHAERRGWDRFIITDGARYACFKKHGEQYALSSYLNIARLRRRYPVYDDRAGGHCGGAVDALLTIAR